MALGLTPEHLELAAAVRGWSQRHCPAEVVRAAADGEDGGGARYRADLAPSLGRAGPVWPAPARGRWRPGLRPARARGRARGDRPGAAARRLPANRPRVGGTGRRRAAGRADESPGAAAPAGATATAQASGAGQAGSTAAKLIARLADGSLAGAVCLATGLTGIRGADGGLTVSGGCSACRATPSRPPSPSPSGRREIDASRASQSGSYRPCAAGAANLSWRACMGG